MIDTVRATSTPSIGLSAPRAWSFQSLRASFFRVVPRGREPVFCESVREAWSRHRLRRPRCGGATADPGRLRTPIAVAAVHAADESEPVADHRVQRWAAVSGAWTARPARNGPKSPGCRGLSRCWSDRLRVRHFVRALKLEPCDSAAHEGIAQLWREWGRPELKAAVLLRPSSLPAAVGERLQHAWYHPLGSASGTTRVRPSSSRCGWTAPRPMRLTTCCYLSVVEANGVAAQQACERALSLEPTMKSAKINLALAFAIQGEVSTAEQRLLGGVTVATGHYNVGILRMSLGESDAADALRPARSRRSRTSPTRRPCQRLAAARDHRC